MANSVDPYQTAVRKLRNFKILLAKSLVTPTEISNTENHKNYYITEVMCPMGSFKYNYGMWSLDICLEQTP